MYPKVLIASQECSAWSCDEDECVALYKGGPSSQQQFTNTPNCQKPKRDKRYFSDFV